MGVPIIRSIHMPKFVLPTSLQSDVYELHSIADKFFLQKETGLYYSVIDPHDPGKINLPRKDEIESDIPNSNGWTTPIEDSNLLSSGFLPALITRYTVAQKRHHADAARSVYRGLMQLRRISKSPGFIPRGVLPDGVTYYRDASLDHESYWIVAMWHYYRSPIASVPERSEIRKAVDAFLSTVEKHQWRLVREDGKTTSWGHLVDGPTVLRAKVATLMFLAVAWDVTEDPRWYKKYLFFRDSHSATCVNNWSVDEMAGEASWVSSQTASLVDVLYTLEHDGSVKEFLSNVLQEISRSAAISMGAYEEYEPERAWSDFRFRTRTFLIPLCSLTAMSLCPDASTISVNIALSKAVVHKYDFLRDAKQLVLLTQPIQYYWRLVSRGLASYDPDIDVTYNVEIEGIPTGTPFQRHHIDWYDSLSHTYKGLPPIPDCPISQHHFVR